MAILVIFGFSSLFGGFDLLKLSKSLKVLEISEELTRSAIDLIVALLYYTNAALEIGRIN